MNLVTPAVFAALHDDGILFQLVRRRPLLRTVHQHTFFELVCVLNGSCAHELDGIAHGLAAGDAMWIIPGQSHGFRSQSDTVEAASLSVTSVHMASAGILPGEIPAGAFRLSPAGLGYLRELAEQTDLLSGAARTAMADGILHFFAGAAAQARCQQTLPAPLRAAMSAMHTPENLRGGVPAFRALMHFSPAQLCRWTQRYLHESPQSFVLRLRLQTACEWLSSDRSLEEIAEFVGFSSYSHFHLQFRQMYGMTPAQMRRKNEGQVRTV